MQPAPLWRRSAAPAVRATTRCLNPLTNLSTLPTLSTYHPKCPTTQQSDETPTSLPTNHLTHEVTTYQLDQLTRGAPPRLGGGASSAGCGAAVAAARWECCRRNCWGNR
jgi:hypothetical protein